ncbi:MAG: hypothetical protein D4R65_00040 [Verrucomicrobiaceae bacterium]|nr:MAG: hypothetical protein D4R65_00040 [Verrucomicrobiaceae bacterium]
MITFRFHFSSGFLRKLLLVLGGVNIVLSLGTMVFNRLWEHITEYRGIVQSFINFFLVQFNLSTENVVSSWYSSMVLLAVAVGSVIAFAADRNAGIDAKSHRWLSFGWLLFGAVFAGLSFDEMASFHERLGMLSQLNFWGQGALGWAYAMAPAIVIVALFMLAFGWFHVRRVRPAFWLIVLGVALFVSDPVLEQVEMLLLQAGAPPGSWARFAHDALVIIEEGGIELFGGLCFLTATIVYAANRTKGSGLKISMESTTAILATRTLTACSLAGMVFTSWAVRHLPPGDIGIPDNWYPAAGLFLLAVVLMATERKLSGEQAGFSRTTLGLALAAIVFSAYFGADTYAYLTWFRFDILRQIFQTFLAAGFVGLCVAYAGGNRGSWCLIAGGALTALSVNVAGLFPAAMATLGAGLCIEGVLRLNSFSPHSTRTTGLS